MFSFFITNLKLFLSICLYIIFLSSTLTAKENDLFTSEDIKIEFSYFKNENIRNKAINKAEKIAFTQISKKLLSPFDYQNLSTTDDLDISYFVESIEFIDEKITSDYYSAVFSIKFNKFRVREYYNSQSLLYSELGSNEINTYVIFSNPDQFFILFNMWNTKWKKITKIGDKLSLKINTFDQLDVKNLSINSYLDGNGITKDNFQLLNDYIVIWCIPNKTNSSKIKFDVLIKLEINNEIKVITKSYTEKYNLYRDDIFEFLMNDVKKELLNMWIEVTAESNELYVYDFKYISNDLSQWISLKQKLENVELLRAYSITSFNINEVEGRIKFAGDNNKLELVLSQNNIKAVNLGPYYQIYYDY